MTEPESAKDGLTVPRLNKDLLLAAAFYSQVATEAQRTICELPYTTGESEGVTTID